MLTRGASSMRTSTASTWTSLDGKGGALAAPSALGVGSTVTTRDSPCGVGLRSAQKGAQCQTPSAAMMMARATKKLEAGHMLWAAGEENE
jgi:hypothetical protein